MNIQIKELFATYEKTKTMVAEQGHMQQSFSVIQNIFEDKKINQMPILWFMVSIMQEKVH
jgi:hypothetical protein